MRFSSKQILTWVSLFCCALGLSGLIWNNDLFLLLPFAGLLWGASFGMPSDWTPSAEEQHRRGLLIGATIGFLLGAGIIGSLLWLVMTNPFF